MKLTIKDRLVIPALLPKQGRIIEMQTVAGIIDQVKFTPEEITRYGLVDSPGGATWNSKIKGDIEVSFLPEQINVLKSGVVKMDESESVTFDMIETIMKIQAL